MVGRWPWASGCFLRLGPDASHACRSQGVHFPLGRGCTDTPCLAECSVQATPYRVFRAEETPYRLADNLTRRLSVRCLWYLRVLLALVLDTLAQDMSAVPRYEAMTLSCNLTLHVISPWMPSSFQSHLGERLSIASVGAGEAL